MCAVADKPAAISMPTRYERQHVNLYQVFNKIYQLSLARLWCPRGPIMPFFGGPMFKLCEKVVQKLNWCDVEVIFFRLSTLLVEKIYIAHVVSSLTRCLFMSRIRTQLFCHARSRQLLESKPKRLSPPGGHLVLITSRFKYHLSSLLITKSIDTSRYRNVWPSCDRFVQWKVWKSVILRDKNFVDYWCDQEKANGTCEKWEEHPLRDNSSVYHQHVSNRTFHNIFV